MYVCLYAYVFMYVCLICMHELYVYDLSVCMRVFMYLRHVCVYVCMYERKYVLLTAYFVSQQSLGEDCIHTCIHTHMSTYTHIHASIHRVPRMGRFVRQSKNV
jgi:hypothetical protein